MTAALYRAYLAHQAATHPDLLHADETGRRVFAMMHVEEVVSDLRSTATEKGFIMRGLHYTYRLRDDGDGRRIIEGGFMVAKQYSAREGGTAAFLKAMDDAERIVNEIVEKMIADSRAGHPLFLHSFDSEQDVSVTPRPLVSDGYAGWMAIFTFSNFFESCLDREDAPAWTDDGITPHNLLA